MTLYTYPRGPNDPPGNTLVCPNGCQLTYTVEIKKKSTEDIMMDLVSRVVLLEVLLNKLTERVKSLEEEE